MEMGVVRATNPVSLHPVRMRNGRTVTKDRVIPADGHSVAKLYSNSEELGASVGFVPWTFGRMKNQLAPQPGTSSVQTLKPWDASCTSKCDAFPRLTLMSMVYPTRWQRSSFSRAPPRHKRLTRCQVQHHVPAPCQGRVDPEPRAHHRKPSPRYHP